MNIYVGNLPQTTNEAGLKETFNAFGSVGAAAIIMDKNTGGSRGFGFVEMQDQTEALAAIDRLNGAEMDGQVLRVKQAKTRVELIKRAYRLAARRG